MSSTIHYRDPADLRLHPLQKQLPEPDKQSPEWISFLEGWQSAGVEPMPPLIVTKEGLIMDGGRRWRAAKQLQWDKVPVIERPEADAAALIVDSLLGQRDMERGLKAYLTLKLLPEYVKSSETRRLANLRSGSKTRQNPLFLPKTLEESSEKSTDLYTRLGLGKETWRRAVQVTRIFEQEEHLREEWEPRFIAGEIGLNRLLSALGGNGADQSKRESGVAGTQLELFTKGLEAMHAGGRYWNALEEKRREEIMAKWRKAAAKMPKDLRQRMAQILGELEEAK